MTLLAFHSDPKVKSKYLRRVRAHRKAEEIVHGKYWQDGKGCAVGCTIHSSQHAAYETELGIPEVIARLEDSIFEGLDNGHSLEWPERFLAAIKPGADLSLVWPKFAVWMLTDKKWGVLRYTKQEQSKKAIQAVSDGWQKIVDGAEISSIPWSKLRSTAAAAAYDAADYADAAAYATYAAAAAAYDAADYADAAAYADAYADARKNRIRIAQADKLIELLEAA
jgi:hypothetical protein